LVDLPAHGFLEQFAETFDPLGFNGDALDRGVLDQLADFLLAVDLVHELHEVESLSLELIVQLFAVGFVELLGHGVVLALTLEHGAHPAACQLDGTVFLVPLSHHRDDGLGREVGEAHHGAVGDHEGVELDAFGVDGFDPAVQVLVEFHEVHAVVQRCRQLGPEVCVHQTGLVQLLQVEQGCAVEFSLVLGDHCSCVLLRQSREHSFQFNQGCYHFGLDCFRDFFVVWLTSDRHLLAFGYQEFSLQWISFEIPVLRQLFSENVVVVFKYDWLLFLADAFVQQVFPCPQHVVIGRRVNDFDYQACLLERNQIEQYHVSMQFDVVETWVDCREDCFDVELLNQFHGDVGVVVAEIPHDLENVVDSEFAAVGQHEVVHKLHGLEWELVHRQHGRRFVFPI